MSDQEENGSKKIHLSESDYRILVTWMELPENFVAIHGAGKKTSIGGKPKCTKAAAFGTMAVHLQRHTANKDLPVLSARNMQQRWTTYKQRFKRTLKASRSETGLGLTKGDIKTSARLLFVTSSPAALTYRWEKRSEEVVTS